MSAPVGTPLSDVLGSHIKIVGQGISGPVMGLMGYDVTHQPGAGGGLAKTPEPVAAAPATAANFMADFKPL